jgi:hypothetical protein
LHCFHQSSNHTPALYPWHLNCPNSYTTTLPHTTRCTHTRHICTQ